MSSLTKKDFWVLLCFWPWFGTAIMYWLFGETVLNNSSLYFPAAILFIIWFVLTWRLHIYADHAARKRLPDIQSLPRRIAISVAMHFMITVSYITIPALLAQWLHASGYRFAWPGYLRAVATGFCGNLATIGFHEAVYMFYSWKKTWREAEALKKNNLKSQLAGLRNQVKPHFLFNGLNTLSSLIATDGSRAEAFLDELCKVYRYLLHTDKGDLIMLRKEIAFINSWFFILKTRYSNGIHLQIDVPPADEDKQVPILTLMTVLEDVLYLNTISKNHPLKITIKSLDNSRLLISNIQQPKKNLAGGLTGNTAGLEHLAEKYRLMGGLTLTVAYRDNWRHVELPLFP